MTSIICEGWREKGGKKEPLATNRPATNTTYRPNKKKMSRWFQWHAKRKFLYVKSATRAIKRPWAPPTRWHKSCTCQPLLFFLLYFIFIKILNHFSANLIITKKIKLKIRKRPCMLFFLKKYFISNLIILLCFNIIKRPSCLWSIW
jgi:hypothetical protein